MTQTEIKPNRKPTTWRKQRIITEHLWLSYSVGPRAVACVHWSTTEFTSKPEQWHFYRELPAVLSCLLLPPHTTWTKLFFKGSCPSAEMTSMWSHFSIQPLLNRFPKNFWSRINRALLEARTSRLEYRFLHTAPRVPATSLTYFHHQEITNNKRLHLSIKKECQKSSRQAMFLLQEC